VGLSPRAIAEALYSFPGLAHRMENIGQIGRVRFVNDSKATNADAASQALASYDRIYWIAGGIAKAGGIESLTQFFPRMAKAYLIGESAKDFARVMENQVPIEILPDIAAAAAAAARDAKEDPSPEPVVLLSPACASFDQFRDFEHRGDAFREAVEKLIAKAQGKAA
jgi:UDP-N-acetylmuramoylalanine--D-glutamate ligase